MWAYMDQNQNVFTKSNKEGVERVLREEGAYAFMMESTVVDYVVERQCKLTQVGGLLDNKGYGIGLPPSKFRKIQIEFEFEPLRFTISNTNDKCYTSTARGR